MNLYLLKKILSKESMFIPLIFTRKQFFVLKKYNNKKKLSNAEKKALYTSIKKKLNALNYLHRESSEKEYFFQGKENMITKRIEEAKRMIEEYRKDYEKIFVSGSFLFSGKYHDIDIFIITKKGYIEKFEGKKHLIFLTEKKLAQPIFQSAALISVSNFSIHTALVKKKMKLIELISTYHEAIIELMMYEEKPEAARRLIFDYELYCKNNLLNPKQLQEKTKKTNTKILSENIKELLKHFFSKNYIYVELHKYIKTLTESIKKITPNFHLKLFKRTYEELIYGAARS